MNFQSEKSAMFSTPKTCQKTIFVIWICAEIFLFQKKLNDLGKTIYFVGRHLGHARCKIQGLQKVFFPFVGNIIVWKINLIVGVCGKVWACLASFASITKKPKNDSIFSLDMKLKELLEEWLRYPKSCKNERETEFWKNIFFSTNL